MLWPPFLKSKKEKAISLVKDHGVGEIAFSGPTYQVEVFGPEAKKGEWAFIQLGSEYQLKDYFCSCQDSEEEGGCLHLSAAWYRLFQDRPTPLHELFSVSFWKALFSHYEEAYGSDPSQIEKVVKIEGNGVIEPLLEDRGNETEETSLKFSNLTEEEIAAWKKGKPSASLRFELSFWCDLAKIFMVLQDGGASYQVKFLEKKGSLPKELEIKFPKIKLICQLTEKTLLDILPTLHTVESNLKVFEQQDLSIEKVTYDPEQVVIQVHVQEGKKVTYKDEIPFNGWVYVPGKGFYFKQISQIEKLVWEKEELDTFFENYLPLAKEKLAGTSISDMSLRVKYTLHFDVHHNLHLLAYLFEKGDMSRKQSHLFHSFAYIENQGFFPIYGKEFDSVETIIQKDAVAHFIWEHKEWLANQEGFQTHLKQVDTKLEFQVTHDGVTFERTLPEEKGIDLGFWVYVPDEGFFPKSRGSEVLPIKHALTLRREEVAPFFRKYHRELRGVSGLFTDKCPIVESGLKVALNQKEQIIISPVYRTKEEFRSVKPLVFEEFFYFPSSGFYELPTKLRLKERYREPQTITVLPAFFNEEMPAIEDDILEIDRELTSFGDAKLIGKSLEKKQGAYFLKLELQGSRGSLPLASLWTALKEKKIYFFSPMGRIDLTEEMFRWLREFSKVKMNKRKNVLELTLFDLIRLHSLLPFELEEGEELLTIATKQLPEIKLLTSHLRPYQIDGVKWLWSLFKEGFSSLLCDEMGLGKTHQAMALIAASFQENKENRKFLVLCPLSVIYHWEEKLAKFLPSLKVLTYYGMKRNIKDFDSDTHLLLTSYGIFRNEAKEIGALGFELAILDEMQAAKNPGSRLWQALKKLKSHVIVGLTGTPIENKIVELKSLFDLILPGYMPKDADYKRFFVKPIEQLGDQQRKERLTHFIQPFVLRRKKKDVLQELPDKIEEIEHCQLTQDQTILYNEVLQLRKSSILNELTSNGKPLPFIHIFALLSSLKQICNHPAVYYKKPQDYEAFTSGKWELFLELLREARGSGQKVVVFSQYLAMLDIIESYLRKEKIQFAAIRGETVKRGQQVALFNNNPDCEVFVGSLQAAGWGIDLTAASVVIHYDRWWNAAREDQATDRVHRFGQTRGVQVFKLVTKGTFEERIDQLIEQKGKLMEEVVTPDDHRFLKQFDRNEILELLKDAEFQ